MAKAKQTEAPASGEKITQRVAVQRAIAAGKDSPSDGVTYVKEQFGMELSNQSFSTLKSQLKKAAGTPMSSRGRSAKATATPASTNGAPNMASQIEAIKTLVDSLGVDQVVSIAKLFAK